MLRLSNKRLHLLAKTMKEQLNFRLSFRLSDANFKFTFLQARPCQELQKIDIVCL